MATLPANIPPTTLAALAQQFAGPLAAPAAARSQYLAEALQQMQGAGKDIRTGGALASNLLANGLLRFERGRNDAKLAKLYQGGQANTMHALTAGSGLDDQAPADAGGSPAASEAAGGMGAAMPPANAPPMGGPAPAMGGPSPAGGPALAAALAGASPSGGAPSPQGPAPVVAFNPMPQGGPPPAPDAAPGPSSPNQGGGLLASLARHFTGEGYPPAAAAGLAGNFQAESSGNPSANNAKEGAFGLGQWEGPRRAALVQFAQAHNADPSDPQVQLAFTDSELNGPEGKAKARLMAATDPASGNAAALSYERPAGFHLADPTGSSNYAGRLAASQAAFSALQPQGGPGAAPYEVASNGPTPPPPGGPPMAAPGGPPPMAPPQGGPPAPAAPERNAPPVGSQATPEERARFHALASNPSTYGEALELAQTIQARASSPVSAPPGTHWQGGKLVSDEPYTDVQGPEGAITQRGFDGQVHVTADPSHGAIPEGYQLSGGRLVPMGGPGASVAPQPLTDPAERAKWGIGPADHASYAMTLKGPVKVADSPFTPGDIKSMRESFWGSDETKKAQEGIAAYNGLVGIITKYAPSGINNSAGMDSFLRGINPGMGAKNSTVTMVLDHIGGLSQAVREHVLSKIDGNGYLTPQVVQQMAQVINEYTSAHVGAARWRADQDAKSVASYGYTPKDLAEDLPNLQPLPSSNSPGYTLPGGHGAPSQPPGPVNPSAPAGGVGAGGVGPGAGNRGSGAGAPGAAAQRSPAYLAAVRAELAKRDAAKRAGHLAPNPGGR